VRCPSPFFPVLLLLIAPLSGLRAQSADSLFEAGRKAFQQQSFLMAGRSFGQLVEQYPDSPLADDADYLKGLSAFYLGDYAACINTLRNYGRKYPRSANLSRVSYWLGNAAFQLGQYREALARFQSQVQDYPEESGYLEQSLLLMGMSQEKLGAWNEAGASYRRLVERPSASSLWPEALFRLGGVQLRGGEYASSLTCFTRILVEFPQSPFSAEAVFYAAESAFFLGRYPEAEKRYRTALAGHLEDAQWETALFRLATVLAAEGKPAESLQAIEELTLRFPRGSYGEQLRRLKADQLYDLGRYPEAAAAYQKALESAADEAERQILSYNLGLSRFYGGQLAQCVEPLRAASGSGSAPGGAGAPDPAVAEQSLFRLGNALAQLGRTAEARLALQELQRRFPASELREEAVRLLGLLCFQDGSLAEAEEAYSLLLNRYPYSSYRHEYLFRRASVRLARDEAPKAMEDFYALLEQTPGSPYAAESRYNLGYIYSERGEFKRALPFFTQAAESPGSEELAGRAVLAAGVCEFNAGEYEQALRWFARNTGETGSDASWAAESWLYAGRTYYKLDRLEEAVESFGRAAAMSGGQAQGEEALFWQGLCQFRLNRLAAAEKTFLSVASLYPRGRREAESLYRAGMCASLAGGYERGVGYFDRALKAARGQGAEYGAALIPEVLYQEGLAYLQAGRRREAAAAFETLGRDFPGASLAPEGFFKLAEKDYRDGEYTRARQGFELVLARFPDSAAAQSGLYWAGMSASGAGDTEAALDYLVRYLESSPQGGLGDMAVEQIRALLEGAAGGGAGVAPGGGPGRLVEDFYRRVEASGRLPIALKNQVRYEYARSIFASRPDGAMAVLQALRAAEPAEPLRSEVNLLVGEYYRQTGALARALDIFTGITGGSSGRSAASAQAAVAGIYEQQGKKTQAAEEYLKVYFLYPEQRDLAQEGLYQAGRVYWELGKREDARRLFEKLRSEYPDSPWLSRLPEG
jgi:TolA-binding protein